MKIYILFWTKIKLLKTLDDNLLYNKTFAILIYYNYWIRCLRIDRMFWLVTNVIGEVGRSHKARTPMYEVVLIVSF